MSSFIKLAHEERLPNCRAYKATRQDLASDPSVNLPNPKPRQFAHTRNLSKALMFICAKLTCCDIELGSSALLGNNHQPILGWKLAQSYILDWKGGAHRKPIADGWSLATSPVDAAPVRKSEAPSTQPREGQAPSNVPCLTPRGPVPFAMTRHCLGHSTQANSAVHSRSQH